MKTSREQIDLCLSALGLLAMGLLYILWLYRHSYPAGPRFAAFLSAVDASTSVCG